MFFVLYVNNVKYLILNGSYSQSLLIWFHFNTLYFSTFSMCIIEFERNFIPLHIHILIYMTL
jgi:hypothetical protein